MKTEIDLCLRYSAAYEFF